MRSNRMTKRMTMLASVTRRAALAAVLATITAVGAACGSTGPAAAEVPASPDNLAVARRFVEGFLGGKDPAAIDELAHEDVAAYTGLKPDGPIRGRQQYKDVFAMFTAAFPDVKLDIEDMFAAGDRVVVRFKAVATHKGELFGIKPTNRVITMIETHVLRLEGGKIVENRVGGNNLEFAMLMAPVLTPMILPDNGPRASN